MVPAVGVEPTRAEAHRILSPARLPFHHAGSHKYCILKDTKKCCYTSTIRTGLIQYFANIRQNIGGSVKQFKY